MGLVHFHRHSRWSLLDGTGHGDDWAAAAASLGQSALALTDHATLAGALEHVAGCQAAGIAPILGCEVYMRPNRLDHTPRIIVDEKGKQKGVAPQRWHLTLLALNSTGWVNLMRLVSETWRSGFYHRPCADFDLLARHNDGIFCLLGCIGGMFAGHLQSGGLQLDPYLQLMRSIFGDRLAVEIQPHDFDGQRQVNIDTLNVANDHSLLVLATGDAHMITPDMAAAQETMLMLATGQTNLKRKRKQEAGEDIYTMHQENPTLWLMSEQQMADSFAAYHPLIPAAVIQNAINATGELMSQFEPIYIGKQIKMPTITPQIVAKIDDRPPDPTLDADETVRQTLRRWCEEGLAELKDIYPPEHWTKFPESSYVERYEHELGVLERVGMHAVRYMLMAAGEVRWAKRNEIVVGPGRGSAAGSLVAYLTGITDIDPLPYRLKFGRFINENRKGMPDIDIDFMPGAKGKDRVIAHTAEIYGEGNVIPIATFAMYGPRSALGAVCRVFDDLIDYPTAQRYQQAIDLKPTDKADLQECSERFPEVAEFKRRYPTLWDVACKIEGHPYAQSEHASGVLVKPAQYEMPTMSRADGPERYDITAWTDTREQLANHGWLKLDYLVIEGLVRQHEIMRALKERENTPVDLRRLPVRWDPDGVDPEVMEIFSRGDTLGVWQFEGKGSIPILKEVRPTNMEDLTAINALIRPGAREMVNEYAKRKHREIPETAWYWHPAFESILKPTYGLLVYQEQVMDVVQALAGFSEAEADDLRKAMGKKYREGLKAVVAFLDQLGYGPRWMNGASQVLGEQLAAMVWDRIIGFGEYSFNKSHAAAYALISYHDALFKKLAPADFYAWYLTSSDTKDLPRKLSASLREGRHAGIKISPPDINFSDMQFKVLDRQTILYGIESVKGIGAAGAKSIFENRPYRSYEDFEARVPRRAVNAAAREALIGAGAFDAFGLRNDLSDAEKADREMAYIGMKITGKSDVDTYAPLIEETIHTYQEFLDAEHRAELCVGGEVTGVKPTTTKKSGEAMGFVTVAYGADEYRVTLFPQAWSLYGHKCIEGRIVFFEGTKDVSEQYGHGFIGRECLTLEELQQLKAQPEPAMVIPAA